MSQSDEGKLATVRQLLKHTSKPSIDDLKDMDCNICLRPYLTGDCPEGPIKLRCGHIYGQGCLIKLFSSLLKNPERNKCPMCQKPILGQTTPRDQRQAYGYNLLAESDRLSRARRELESLFDRHVLLNVPIPGFSRKWSRVARRACGDQLLAEIHRLNAARHKVDDLFDMYIIGDTPIPDHAQKSYAGPSILGPGFLMSTCEPGSNISSAEQMVFGQAKISSVLETSGSADLSLVSTPLPPSPESMPPPPRPTAASLAVGSEPYPTEFEFWQTHRRAGGARFPA